jgi:hypothetical protein
LEDVTTTAGKQQLAVYVTNSSDVFKAKTVSSRLTQNFTNSGTYAVVDRTSDFRAELNRQHSGRVDDSQISRLGRQFGVNQVCIVDVLSSDYTAVRIINVETGIIAATAEAMDWRFKDVDRITRELMSYYAPPHATSTKTWEFGDQIWSDAIQMPECNKTSFTDSETKPDCRSYTSNRNTWYYYNWPYVIKNSVKMCPSPWRVPSKSDFSTLVSNTTNSTLINAWGYGGLANSNLNFVANESEQTFYCSSTEYSGATNRAYYLTYYSCCLFVDNTYKGYGFQVRCVK